MQEPNILIKSALSEVVQQVNAGASPTEALQKVAHEYDLNPDYIQRTGEALNVALNYNHFKKAADRSSEFAIADIPAVVANLFGQVEKTAAEEAAEMFPVNNDETVFNYSRALSNPMYKRAFLEITGATETADSFPTTFRRTHEKAANYIDNLAKQADEAYTAKIGAEIELNAQFSALAQEFRKAADYHTPFEEVESQVFAKHGAAAVPYLDLLHKTACEHAERGVHDAGYLMFEQCKEAAMFDAMLAAGQAMVDTEKQANEAQENLEFEANYLRECTTAMGKVAQKKDKDTHGEPPVKTEEADDSEPEDPVLAMIKKKASEASESVKEAAIDPVLAAAMEKEAFFGIGGMLGVGKMLHGLIGESDPAHEAFQRTFNKPMSTAGPKPNLTMENMERKLLLQELIITDPILSRQPATKVVRAYEQLIRLSPEISKEKEVVRAELRAMCATQALSKFDAEQMSKMDLGMLKRRAATQDFNSGNTTNFKF